MTGLVVVSHSRELAEAVVSLARQLLSGVEARVAVAAGLPDGGLGTDATAVATAVGQVDDGDGVLVLMDLGSGVLSAQTALELLEPGLAARTRLSAAPLMEGLVAAYAAAGLGRGLEAVAAEAEGAWALKRAQVLGE